MPENKVWACGPRLPERKLAFPLEGIFLLLLECLAHEVFVLHPLLWLRPHWQRLGRRLGRETILRLVWMESATAGRKDMPSGHRKLSDILPSTRRTSLMCERKVSTYLLLLRRTCLVQLSYHLDSVPPWLFWRSQLHDGLYFIWVDLNTSLGHHEP